MSKIIVSTTGWCEADPIKMIFQYCGSKPPNVQNGKVVPSMFITGKEWLSLKEDEKSDYILECVGTVFSTAIHAEYGKIDIDVKEE